MMIFFLGNSLGNICKGKRSHFGQSALSKFFRNFHLDLAFNLEGIDIV